MGRSKNFLVSKVAGGGGLKNVEERDWTFFKYHVKKKEAPWIVPLISWNVL